jgi:hypothetical protein
MGIVPLSDSEYESLFRFIRKPDVGETNSFSQSPDMILDGVKRHSTDSISICLTSKTTGRSLTLVVFGSDFLEPSKDVELASEGSGMSPRAFDMSVALTEFGHIYDLERLKDGSTLRILPHGYFREVPPVTS